ncbi:MAG: hypothetical protein HY547_10070, partial [Elusimicrobia bacterium]|nr:hypothetical protein [Elusimicrobiota bacterium]
MSPAVLLSSCFFVSGAAGLIYQTVWMRMLGRVFGVSMEAAGVAVAVFLGGLALGAWLAGRRVWRARQALGGFAALEMASALLALLSSVATVALPGWIAKLSGGFLGGGSIERLVLSALVLMPPTMMMGATLPLACRFYSEMCGPGGVGLLYGINTLGASLGALFAGFVSIALWGERATVGIAAIFNLTAAAGAGVLWRRVRGVSFEGAGMEKNLEENFGSGEDRQEQISLDGWLFLLAAVSGAAALAHEILWMRMLTLVVGTSVYAFALVLAVYLGGMAGGSLTANLALRLIPKPAFLLGSLEIALALAQLIGLKAFQVAGLSLTDPKYFYSSLGRWQDFVFFFGFTAACVLPGAFLLGLIFPIFVRLAADGKDDSGRVGSIYSWNTWGSIAGSLT